MGPLAGAFCLHRIERPLHLLRQVRRRLMGDRRYQLLLRLLANFRPGQQRPQPRHHHQHQRKKRERNIVRYSRRA